MRRTKVKLFCKLEKSELQAPRLLCVQVHLKTRVGDPIIIRGRNKETPIPPHHHDKDSPSSTYLNEYKNERAKNKELLSEIPKQARHDRAWLYCWHLGSRDKSQLSRADSNPDPQRKPQTNKTSQYPETSLLHSACARPILYQCQFFTYPDSWVHHPIVSIENS